MRWRTRTFADFAAEAKHWHPVFAWLPVFCLKDRATVWLGQVERRLVDPLTSPEYVEWEYRLPRSNTVNPPGDWSEPP